MKHLHSRSFQIVSLFLLCSLILAPAAFATNGMNMEGYGPIATGMGGASFAYDNGSAAVMNNPATIGLMPEGNRLDVAIGFLRPDITSSVPTMPDAESSADLFMMPAIGWLQKKGLMAYGVGVFAQGGMGTEYGADSFLAMPTGAPTGDKVRSELGVGRFIVPFVYSATPDLNLGLSLDYVWASLDLQMALPFSQLGGLVTNCAGPLCGALTDPTLSGDWARIDFSGGGDFNGAAKGTGFAGKLGVTYKISPEFTVGATYHSKTSLGDLETESTGAAFTEQTMGAVPGKIIVRDFQWPETYGIGVAWVATKGLLIAADIKQIQWKDVMKEFKLTFEGAGSAVDFALPQNWDNQTVYELGAAYQFTPEFTGRIGFNISDNPIPDTYLNFLFPATIKNHYTIGMGYAFNTAHSADFSYSYAPEVKVTAGSGVATSHSQGNAQIMYSYRF